MEEINMETTFAYGLNFYKLFWIFVIGCFLGVIIEMFWCMFRYHKLESRKGLVWGPFNLVYGFGALVMTLGLWPVMDSRPAVLFMLGSVLGGAYEYVCSVIQERVVGTVSWDYRNFPLNLNGRINLLYCFFWGILALFWGKGLYPVMSAMIERIPLSIGIPLTWFGVMFFIIDTIHSALVVYRMNERQGGNCSVSRFWSFYDRRYPNEKVRRIYPNMKFRCTLDSGTKILPDKQHGHVHLPSWNT